MLADDIPNDMPVPPALLGLAGFLDAYNFEIGVATDYHVGPDDSDLTMFAVYALQPTDNVMRGKQLMGRIKVGKRQLVFSDLRDFEGSHMKQKLYRKMFKDYITAMGDRLEVLGQPRSRLNEYVNLIHTYDRQRNTYATPAEVVAAMRLPLRLFDLGQILCYRSDLIPELEQYAHMPRSYLENLFDVENLREQDTVYRTMKKYGHLPKLS